MGSSILLSAICESPEGANDGPTLSDANASGGPASAVVAKLIVPAEMMATLAQSPDDRDRSSLAGHPFARLPLDAGSAFEAFGPPDQIGVLKQTGSRRRGDGVGGV